MKDIAIQVKAKKVAVKLDNPNQVYPEWTPETIIDLSIYSAEYELVLGVE